MYTTIISKVEILLVNKIKLIFNIIFCKKKKNQSVSTTIFINLNMEVASKQLQIMLGSVTIMFVIRMIPDILVFDNVVLL